MFKELYDYREMIRNLVRRDLMGRYKNSVLGFLWNFLDPLLQLLIYTVVFTVILPMGIENYYIHLFVALVPWMFFSSSVAGGTTAVLNQQDMVKKIYFPREVLPISHVTSQLVNMLLSFIVVFAVLLVSGQGVRLVAVIWLPVVILIEYVFALGIALIVSSVTVYLRDMQQIVNVMIMALMYASPVIYSVDVVPDEWYNLYMINPMSVVIVAYRDILFYKQTPRPLGMSIAAGVSIVILVIGFLLFNRLKRNFVEEM